MALEGELPGEPEQDESVQAVPPPSVEDYAEVLRRRQAQLSTVGEAAQAVDPNQAAKVIRLSRRYKIPENFAGENIDALEAAEKKGELAKEDLVENHPIIASAIQRSPYAGSLILKNLPNLKKLDLLYMRPIEEWPDSTDYIKEQSAKIAEIKTERFWSGVQAAPEPGQEVLAPFGDIGQSYSSREEAYRHFYDAEIAERTRENAFLSESAPLGIGGVLQERAYKNPFAIVPFASGVWDLSQAGELLKHAKRLEAGTADEVDIDYLRRAARMEAWSARRGTSFLGKVTDVLSGLPAFAGELSTTGGLGTSAIPTLTRGAAESTLKWAFRSVLAGAGRAAVQALPARGLESAAASVQGMVPQLRMNEAGEIEAIPGTGDSVPAAALHTLTRAFADIAGAKGGGVLSAPVQKVVQALGGKIGPIQEALSKGGINPFLGGVAQTEMTKLLNSLMEQKPYIPPTGEELGATALAFSLPHMAGIAIDTAKWRAERYAEATTRRAELLHENLSTESPQVAAELSTDMAQAGPHNTMWVPSNAWKEHWESRGVNPGEKLSDIYGPEGVDRFENAIKSGADIAIPTPGWDHVIGRDPEALKAFRPEIRENPGAMNAREAHELSKVHEAQPSPEVTHEAPINYRALLEGKPEPALPEIQKAAIERERTSLESIQDPTALGLHGKQIDKYRDVEAKAQEEAANTLLERETLRQRARASKEFDKDVKATHEAVTKEVDARPEQKALAFLKKGTQPNGDPLPDNTQPFKLSREDLKSQFGEKILNQLPKGVHAENGIHQDAAAEHLGFKSGHELVKALVDLNRNPLTEKEAILRQRQEALEATRSILSSKKVSLEGEEKAQTKEVLAGREKMAERVAKAMREHEKQSRAELQAMVNEFKEKKLAGMSSDEIAQEFADRGRIKDAYVDTLNDKIDEWQKSIKESKEREKDASEEAKKQAREVLPETLEALIKNREEQAGISGKLESLSKEGMDLDRRKATIQAEVERQIDAKYPKGWTPEELSDEAISALHGEKAGELKHLQLQYIAENHLSALKGMQGVAARRLRSLPEIRGQAKMDLLGRKFSEIGPEIKNLLSSEREAEREAKAAVWKPNWEGVFDAKLKALEAHERYRAALEARDTINKTFDLGRSLVKSEAWNRADSYDWGQQGKDILRRIGLVAIDPKELKTKQPLAEWLKENKVADELGREPLAITADANFLNESFTTDYRDMTYGDVLILRRTLDQLKKGAENLHNTVVEGKKAAIRDTADEFKRTLLGSVGTAPPQARSKAGLSTPEKLAEFSKKQHGSLMDPERMFRQWDGGKIDGPFTRVFWNGYNESQVKFDAYLKRWSSALREADKQMPKEVRSRLGEKISIPGTDEPITRSDAILIAAYGSSESGYTKLKEGEQILKAKNRNWGLTEDQLHYAVGQLTEAEKDHSQNLINAFEGFWPETEALHTRLTGHPPDKVEAKQMLPEMGDRKGGYFPIMYRPGFSHAGDLQVSENPAESLFKPGYQYATTDGGYRISRTDYVGPLSFDIGRLSGQVRSMCQDLAFREFAINSSKLLRDDGVKDVLRDHLGTDGETFIREWLNRSINKANQSSSESAQTWNSLIGKARHAQTIATLGARVSVFLHHALGIDTTMREIGVEAYAKGMKEFFSRPKEWVAQMKAEAPDIAHVIETGGDPNVYESLQTLEGKSGTWAQFQRLAMMNISMGNMLRAGPTYVGAKMKAFEALQAEGKSPEEAERLAIRQAAQSVRLSVGSGRPGDLPGIYDSSAMKMLLMYFTPSRVRYGQMSDAVKDFKKTGNFTRLAGSFLVFPMMGAALHALGRGDFGPDEDKDETWPGWIGKGTFDYGLSSVPLGSMAAKGIEAALTGDHQKFSQSIPLVDSMTKALEAISLTRRWWEDEAEWTKAFDATQRAVGQFAGYPSEQFSVSGGYMLDLMNGTTDDPNDILEFIRNVLWRRKRAS